MAGLGAALLLYTARSVEDVSSKSLMVWPVEVVVWDAVVAAAEARTVAVQRSQQHMGSGGSSTSLSQKEKSPSDKKTQSPLHRFRSPSGRSGSPNGDEYQAALGKLKQAKAAVLASKSTEQQARFPSDQLAVQRQKLQTQSSEMEALVDAIFEMSDRRGEVAQETRATRQDVQPLEPKLSMATQAATQEATRDVDLLQTLQGVLAARMPEGSLAPPALRDAVAELASLLQKQGEAAVGAPAPLDAELDAVDESQRARRAAGAMSKVAEGMAEIQGAEGPEAKKVKVQQAHAVAPHNATPAGGPESLTDTYRLSVVRIHSIATPMNWFAPFQRAADTGAIGSGFASELE
ncbi:unnamed protein product, partial [Prorocentrum cordatum]